MEGPSAKRPRAALESEAEVPEVLNPGDLTCPICFDVFQAVQVTTCGHSFCRKCIEKSLQQGAECPVCKTNLRTQTLIGFTCNYALNDAVCKLRQREDSTRRDSPSIVQIREHMSGLTSFELRRLSEEAKQAAEKRERGFQKIQRKLLTEFLQAYQQHATKEMKRWKGVTEMVSKDLQSGEDDDIDCILSPEEEAKLAHMKGVMYSNMEDFQQTYLNLNGVMEYGCASTSPEDSPETCSTQTYTKFLQTLVNSTQFSSFRDLATLFYGDGNTGASSVVSSIEFDKDGELFAVAGVTKKIKIFDYATVTNQSTRFVAIHYPVREISCPAKLSSVAYSPYYKQQLAAIDYDGALSLYDAQLNQCFQKYQEHEKRVWSVDYNKYDAALLATGGDDCSLKLWHLTVGQSVQTYMTRTNVCSVRFQPGNRYYLAYGSADHNIRLVDIRKFSEPVMTLQGHRKAVSYVQFLNDTELVSASTDNELKLWSVENGTCLRTFRGHTNEKNFVGLTVDASFIACGSENNSFYVYEQNVSQPVLSYPFNISRNILPTASDQRLPDSNSSGHDFVSSVCFRKGSKVIVAANSQGYVKVLEMM